MWHKPAPADTRKEHKMFTGKQVCVCTIHAVLAVYHSLDCGSCRTAVRALRDFAAIAARLLHTAAVAAAVVANM